VTYVVVQYFYWSVCLFVALGSKFLDNGSLLSLNGSPQNFHTSLVCGKTFKATFENFSSEPQKIVGKRQSCFPTFISHTRFRKELMDCNSDFKISNSDDFCI